MNLQQGDILVRNYDGTQTVWLSQRLVMEVCGISENQLAVLRNAYKKSVRSCDLAKSKDFLPDSGKAWRWAKTSNGFYYCLDNIPNKAPKHYRELFGDKEALLELWERTQKSLVADDLETRFKRHLRMNARHFTEHYTDANELQRVALTKACATLDAHDCNTLRFQIILGMMLFKIPKSPALPISNIQALNVSSL